VSSTPAPIETAAVSSPAADVAEATPPDTDTATPTADATPAPSVSDTATAQSPSQPRAALPALSAETMVAAAATTLALAALAVFGIWLWRRRPAELPPVNRDIADISFDGGRAAPALALEGAPPALAAPVSASLDGEESDDAKAAALPVPATYAEALEILGAGPDASTSAIKKIVDGLRQSWHPDLARSESDRLRREARVRQINVAWDLVAQRRSAA
jgi:hypothetical protein